VHTHTQQDVELDKLFADVCVYNARIMGPAHLVNVMELACRTALARRGVAHVTMPVDMQSMPLKALLQRIHPAPRRVRRLAQETPAQLIVFDLLAGVDGAALVETPLQERRMKLETFFERYIGTQPAFQLSPATTRLDDAKGWLDGIIAKRRDLDYRSGDRSGMQKIKSFRSAGLRGRGLPLQRGKQRGRVVAAGAL
jgi:ATP-dependent DNA ligase